MRRQLLLVPVAGGAVTLAGAARVPAGAGGTKTVPAGAPLTIEKEVDGAVPPDTEFTVTVECDRPIIFRKNSESVASATVDFNSEGDADGSNTITFTSNGTCTVKETEDGDAEDVSYECEGQIPSTKSFSSEFASQDDISDPCESHGPQEDPIRVFIDDLDQSATVTVTNEFPEPEQPPAAQPVARVVPTFTG